MYSKIIDVLLFLVCEVLIRLLSQQSNTHTHILLLSTERTHQVVS